MANTNKDLIDALEVEVTQLQGQMRTALQSLDEIEAMLSGSTKVTTRDIADAMATDGGFVRI